MSKRSEQSSAPTLVITNDFPPTIGGIEGFVADVCEMLDRNVVVLTRRTPGWRDHDHRVSYPVFRTTELLLPTDAVARKATELIFRYRITRVIYGALAPLALLAPRLRCAGAQRQLGITHGHEVWWANVPGARQLLRRMAGSLDRISVISDYTRARIEPALSPASRDQVITLPPPVDCDVFRPAAADGGSLLAATDDDADDAVDGLVTSTDGGPRPRCIAAGRMVAQKGFAVLLDAWRSVLDSEWSRLPELVLIGHGPHAAMLRRQAARWRLDETVRFVGPVDRQQVAALLPTGTVFALPVRTRLGGLQPEGLGRVFLEAAASGLPVIAGRSGGAAEAVIHGETGFVVDPADPGDLAARMTELLADPARAARMGRAGRQFAVGHFGYRRIKRILCAAVADETHHSGYGAAPPGQAAHPVG